MSNDEKNRTTYIANTFLTHLKELEQEEAIPKGMALDVALTLLFSVYNSYRNQAIAKHIPLEEILAKTFNNHAGENKVSLYLKKFDNPDSKLLH